MTGKERLLRLPWSEIGTILFLVIAIRSRSSGLEKDLRSIHDHLDLGKRLPIRSWSRSLPDPFPITWLFNNGITWLHIKDWYVTNISFILVFVQKTCQWENWEVQKSESMYQNKKIVTFMIRNVIRNFTILFRSDSQKSDLRSVHNHYWHFPKKKDLSSGHNRDLIVIWGEKDPILPISD